MRTLQLRSRQIRGLVLEAGGSSWGPVHRPDVALADLDKAIALNPNDTGLHFDRAPIKVQAGRADEAVADLTAVISSDPNNAVARRERGLAFRAIGNRVQALNDFRLYAASNPNDKEVNQVIAALEPRPNEGQPNASLPRSEPDRSDEEKSERELASLYHKMDRF